MNKDFAAVESLERRLLDPKYRVDAFAELLDDNFLEIGRSGRMFTRTGILNSETGSDQVIVEIDSVQCRYLTENLVMVNYRSWRANCTDNRMTYRTSIWQRSKECWKMVFHQGTPIDSETA